MRLLALLVAVHGVRSVFAAPSCVNEDEGERSIHAVIVAGTNVSKGLAYALQGAAYEAYHMLADRGVPKENIVLMSWDDAATTAAPPRTRSSFFFGSHGKVGAWFVGNQLDVPITAQELQTTLKEMHANGKYAELSFTMESCHSGSMFDALPENINIYAITSSNRNENSKCIYCPYWGACTHDEDNWVCKLNGCVSGLFRNKIFGDIESNQEDETLEKQYKSVKSEVAEFCNKHWTTNCNNESQTVSHFGDLNIAKEPVANFTGHSKAFRSGSLDEIDRPFAVWSFKDAEMRQLEHEYSMSVAHGDHEVAHRYLRAMEDLKEKHSKVDKFLAAFVAQFAGKEYSSDYYLSSAPERLTQLECHDTAVRAFQAKCMPHIGGTAYAGKYASVMAALCESGVPQGGILARIEDYC